MNAHVTFLQQNMDNKSYQGYALVYGGNGALGSGIVSHFKANGWFVLCIKKWREPVIKASTDKTAEEDAGMTNTPLMENEEEVELINANQMKAATAADVNVFVHFEYGLKEQENEILLQIDDVLEGDKLDAIMCVAGGYAEGNAENVTENVELLWRQNVWPSVISASIASKHLKNNGFICLSGAKAALDGTPTAVGYGLVKAAVHQLTKSLSCMGGGQSENDVFAVALLPITLDTVVNRQNMPEGDISAWTPTKYITELLYKWALNKDRPKNGSMVQFVTQNFITDVIYL